MPVPQDTEGLTDLLSEGGFVAADEEAEELLVAASGDPGRLDEMVARRLTGEPLAWITGTTAFCGLAIGVAPGVYVPRWQSEDLARRAAERLPAGGLAVDVCTGSGAIAKVLATSRPRAQVVATDADAASVACARSNGVEAYLGDLFGALPAGLDGRVDVVVGVVPYVPTPALPLLQRDTLAFESSRSYDGGPDGTDMLGRVLAESPRLLRRGSALLLELGGDQADLLAGELAERGFVDVAVLTDEDGDVRGIEATYAGA